MMLDFSLLEVHYRKVRYIKDTNGEHGITVCNECWYLESGTELGVSIAITLVTV